MSSVFKLQLLSCATDLAIVLHQMPFLMQHGLEHALSGLQEHNTDHQAPSLWTCFNLNHSLVALAGYEPTGYISVWSLQLQTYFFPWLSRSSINSDQLPSPWWRKASSQHAAATIMLQSGDGAFRVINSEHTNNSCHDLLSASLGPCLACQLKWAAMSCRFTDVTLWCKYRSEHSSRICSKLGI